MKPAEIASVLNRFQENGWPNTLLMTGEPLESKERLVQDAILATLAKSSYETTTTNEIQSKIHEQVYPDYYRFHDGPVRIGEPKDPAPFTVRHLQRHFLRFSGKASEERFVIIPDAVKIHNEAESALLKTLEEPPDHTHFILFADSKEGIKETILSRSLMLHYHESANDMDLPPTAWERFWKVTGYAGSPLFIILQTTGLIRTIANAYESLLFSGEDYQIFEQALWTDIRDALKKEKIETVFFALKLAWLPLFYAIRDAGIDGLLPTEGPIRIPKQKAENRALVRASLEELFSNLQKRYFGTRPPNQNLVMTLFLSQLMQGWVFDSN